MSDNRNESEVIALSDRIAALCRESDQSLRLAAYSRTLACEVAISALECRHPEVFIDGAIRLIEEAIRYQFGVAVDFLHKERQHHRDRSH